MKSRKEIRSLLQTVFYKQIDKAVVELQNAEWQEIEEFDKILDELVSQIMQIVWINDAFNEYPEKYVGSEIRDLICLGFHGL